MDCYTERAQKNYAAYSSKSTTIAEERSMAQKSHQR